MALVTKGAKTEEALLINIDSLYTSPCFYLISMSVHHSPPRAQLPQDAFQDATQHFVTMFPQLILVVTVSENFIVFDDLDSLGVRWSGVSMDILPFAFLCFSHR